MEPPNPTQRITTTLIRYPRFNNLYEAIRECQEVSLTAGEPQCMCLEGRTGAGKTTLVRSYAEAFPRYTTKSGTKIPVFYMETPSPVTVKGMAAEMLDELGDPGAHRGTLWSMNSRLVNFIRDCSVQIVILDDFHHLIDSETNRILRQVSDWLKVLIKRTNIPFLVVGIDGQVRQILRANKQLSRLFVHEELRPFEYNVAKPETMLEFGAFLSYAEHTLEVSFTEEIPRPELLWRFYFATDGVMANIMNVLRKAVRITQREGDGSVLSLSVLAQAYDQRVAGHVNKINPFNLSATEKFTAPPSVIVDEPDGANQRSQRRKNRQPSISETLKT